MKLSNISRLAIVGCGVSLFLSSSTADAFAPAPSSHAAQRSCSAHSMMKLNDIDLMAIKNVAEMCLHSEDFSPSTEGDCDLEEHEALVNQLREQRNILAAQVKEINELISELKGHTVEGHTLSEYIQEEEVEDKVPVLVGVTQGEGGQGSVSTGSSNLSP